MWYHLTRLNDKTFQGMSPQQFEWLKHSQGMSLHQLNELAFTGHKPSLIERQGIQGHEPSTVYDYAMNSTCIYQHTTQLQHNNLTTNDLST